MSSPLRSLPLRSWSVLLFPGLLGLGLILFFSVDVPKEDAWITPGTIFEKTIDGTVTFQDFFSQHLKTESREAFPRLIFFVIGFTVGWHATIFMIISWLCVVGTFLFLLRTVHGTTQHRSGLFYFFVLLLGAMLFSPAQWENQLWGIQLILFVPPLCLATCLWLQSTQLSVGLKVIGCAVLSLIATFSYPNGMACWLLGAPFFRTWFTEWAGVSRQGKTRIMLWTAIYLGLALGTMGFYFYDFETDKIPYSQSLANPSMGLPFFASLIGAPYVRYVSAEVFPAVCVGIGVLLAVIFSIVEVARQWVRYRDADLALSCYPWMCFLGYGVLSCLAVTSGRGFIDPKVALVSEYTSVSLWVTIGLVGLISVLWNYQGIKTLVATQLTFRVTLGLLSVLTLFAWVDGVGQMQLDHLAAQKRHLNLRLLSVAPTNPFFSLNSNWLPPHIIPQRFMLFTQHGLLPVKPIGSWITERIQAPDSGEGGRFRTSKEEDINMTPEEFIRDIPSSAKSLKIEGWAMLPPRGARPDFVVLAQRKKTGDLEVVTGFPLNVNRPDHVLAKNKPRVPHSGFSGHLDATFLENLQFRLFAVDEENQRVYELMPDTI